MDKLKLFLNHERYQVLAFLAIAFLLIWFFGCQSTVNSILDPKRKITRSELEIEVDQFVALADLRFKNLEKQDKTRKYLVDQALLWTSSGTINPIGLVMSVLTLAGTGATIDNVRRRKVEKANSKPPTQ